MTVEQQILTKLDRLNTEISRLRKQGKEDERWVTAHWIQLLTGWDADTLQLARRQQIVKWRRKGSKGVEYLLSSVPDEFKKKIA